MKHGEQGNDRIRQRPKSPLAKESTAAHRQNKYIQISLMRHRVVGQIPDGAFSVIAPSKHRRVCKQEKRNAKKRRRAPSDQRGKRARNKSDPRQVGKPFFIRDQKRKCRCRTKHKGIYADLKQPHDPLCRRGVFRNSVCHGCRSRTRFVGEQSTGNTVTQSA